MKASPLCYVFLLQYWNCLYLRSLAIQLFQEVNSLVLLAQMQTENPFGCPATATEFYASTCECEHWNCICYLKSNSLKYKDCTFWSPDTNPARKNPKKAMIAFFQQKSCMCTVFVPGSETHLSIEPPHFWKGTEWEQRRKKGFHFSDTAQGFFSLVVCQSHQPPGAPGAVQPEGRKASEQLTCTTAVKLGFKYWLKQLFSFFP